MITAKLYGRLGNNLFQMAAAIALAKDNKTEAAFKRSEIWEHVYAHYLKGIGLINYYEENCTTYKEPAFFHVPIRSKDNLILDGYFQSEKYFLHHREAILEAFNFKHEPVEGLVAVHVRRGDYMQFADKHPPVTIEYLMDAMQHFPGMDFHFFSDDIEWCQRNFKGGRYSFALPNTPIADIEGISCCEHQIISNSTFSWWGAWLNLNPYKKVIAPKIWFGPGNRHLDTKDIIPESWIKL